MSRRTQVLERRPWLSLLFRLIPVLFPFALFDQLANLAFDQVALEKAQMVEKEFAVEVIHFVTESAGQKVLPFDFDILAIEIDAFQHDDLWPDDGSRETRHA